MIARSAPAIVAVLFLLCGAFAFAAEHPVSYLPIGAPLPHVMLVDQMGRSFALDEPSNSPTVIAFIYTRCRDARMCPVVSAKFLQLQQTNARMHLLEITLDPAYDRPPVLRRYAEMFGADPSRWRIATGDPTQLAELAAGFGITSRVVAPGTIAHTEMLAVVDAHGRLASLLAGTRWAPDDVVALVRASSDWDVLAVVRNSISASLFPVCGARRAASIAERSAGAVLAVLTMLPVLGFTAWVVTLARNKGA